MSQKHNWDLTVLRPGFIWGRDHGYLGGLGQKLGRLHLVLGPSTRLPLTHVENCGDCFALAAEHPRAIGETFNVVDGHQVSSWRYLGEYLRHVEPRGVASRSPILLLCPERCWQTGSTGGCYAIEQSFPAC